MTTKDIAGRLASALVEAWKKDFPGSALGLTAASEETLRLRIAEAYATLPDAAPASWECSRKDVLEEAALAVAPFREDCDCVDCCYARQAQRDIRALKEGHTP